MNTHIIAMFAVVAAVTVSGQLFGGSQVAEQGIQAAQNSALNLAENDALNQQAALNKEDRRQARLDAKAARQALKNQRQALREARRLAASEQLEAAEFTNAAQFNELDAAADVSSAQKFGLQILSENKHDESARISSSNGAQFNTGSKLNAASSIDAADYIDAETVDQAEAIDQQAISAANENEDILNAREGLQKQDNFLLQAQDMSQFGQFGGRQGGLNFGGAFGGFGGGLFGKRR